MFYSSTSVSPSRNSTREASFFSNKNTKTATTTQTTPIPSESLIIGTSAIAAYRSPYPFAAPNVATIQTAIIIDNMCFGAYLDTNDGPSGEKNISARLNTAKNNTTQRILAF